MKPRLALLLTTLLLAAHGCAAGLAQNSPPPATAPADTAAAVRAEQIRTECVKGRRLICGRVLKVFPEGLVVDSGYTDLLRPPLTESWVVPGTATVKRSPTVVELNEPGTPCIGLVFLTDIPKRPKVNAYDYVLLTGYPAGKFVYSPAPTVKKTIRKFAAGLDTAVRLRLQAEAETKSANAPGTSHALSMPENESGPVPRLLSQTGVFKSVRDLAPSDELLPYDINVSFWSDGAGKSRWMYLPSHGAQKVKVGFRPQGEWAFPPGSVFVKHFELATDETRPGPRHRLETRLLVCAATGGVYGVTYKWRPDNSDADLLTSNLTEAIAIKTAGGTRTQTWYYPSRQDCRTCHTDTAGGVLGVKTRQANLDVKLANGATENQLRVWNRMGLFEPALREEDIPHFARLAPADDLSRSLEDRARSYLDANCSNCHRPGGTVAYFDARYDTPPARQEIVNGPVLIDQGLDKARVVAPNDIWRSVALLRISSLEGPRMPPLAHETLDRQGIALLSQWIESLPGPKVLPPPGFSPSPGKYPGPLEVTLSHPEPGVTIRYTTDGSAPTTSDPVYQSPLKLTEPTTVRARAFKAGFTKSIVTQATFIIGD